jgi:hypothetical protein
MTGSSNHYNALGFWHVLNAKANAIQSYWQFPQYFSVNLQQLPDITLAALARNKIPSAQYIYSLKLLKNKRSKIAKVYWQASISNTTDLQRKKLARQLFKQSRWDDLNVLAKRDFLPEGYVQNHLNLQTSKPYPTLPNQFMKSLGFLLLNAEIKTDQQCLFNVLMMSEHRSGLYKLAALINTYSKQPEPRRNTFCFSQPVYAAGAINCNNTVTKMAQCNWQPSSLKTQLSSEFDFIVMMSKHGSANVKKAVMQLSSQTNYNVFLHELMHFNDFEDEYVLPHAKQLWLCKQRGFVAPNLFISHGDPAPAGWHKSESCQQGGVAYKPAKQWSIMQYQQLGLSDQYRALWQAHIKSTYSNYGD